NNNLTNRTDALGGVTSYTYNDLDLLASVRDRAGTVLTITYDTLNRAVQLRRSGGATISVDYDARDRMVGYSDGSSSWSLHYDQEGREIARTAPLGQTETTERDVNGRATGVDDPGGGRVEAIRDAFGRVVSRVDELGHETMYRYEPRGAMSEIRLPLIGALSFQHGPKRSLRGMTDFNGNHWDIDYSLTGQPLYLTDPLSNTVSYIYDVAGRLISKAFADGSVETSTRDAFGNTLRRLYTDGTDLNYAYDALGRLTNANHVGISYDPEGRPVSTRHAGLDFGATYDSAGRLASAVYNNGAFAVTYSYIPETGQLRAVQDGLTGTRIEMVYDANQRLVGITRPNGADTTWSIDERNRLVRLQHGTFVDLRYGFDDRGQVISTVGTLPTAPGSLFVPGEEPFSYDVASQVASPGYHYDPRGRLTNDPSGPLVWDDASRLLSYAGVSYDYNGLHDRITRSTSGQTHRYFYNRAIPGIPLVAERDESSLTFRAYYVWSPKGELLYMIDPGDGNTVYHFHFDHAGSTLALTDDAGTVTDSYAYDGFGRLLQHNGSRAQPFTYIGESGDRSEGGGGTFYLMRARYYDARSARFIMREPDWPVRRLPLRANPYQYAYNNPVNRIDASGFETEGTAFQQRMGTLKAKIDAGLERVRSMSDQIREDGGNQYNRAVRDEQIRQGTEEVNARTAIEKIDAEEKADRALKERIEAEQDRLTEQWVPVADGLTQADAKLRDELVRRSEALNRQEDEIRERGKNRVEQRKDAVRRLHEVRRELDRANSRHNLEGVLNSLIDELYEDLFEYYALRLGFAGIGESYRKWFDNEMTQSDKHFIFTFASFHLDKARGVEK
ncbi:MAG: RHS repeat-associated core domain-containing protein, partial [Verrucomicrobiota bacterium]